MKRIILAALLSIPALAAAANVRNADKKPAHITVKSNIIQDYTVNAGGTLYNVCAGGGTLTYKGQTMPCSADSRHKIENGKLSSD